MEWGLGIFDRPGFPNQIDGATVTLNSCLRFALKKCIKRTLPRLNLVRSSKTFRPKNHPKSRLLPITLQWTIILFLCVPSTVYPGCTLNSLPFTLVSGVLSVRYLKCIRIVPAFGLRRIATKLWRCCSVGILQRLNSVQLLNLVVIRRHHFYSILTEHRGNSPATNNGGLLHW